MKLSISSENGGSVLKAEFYSTVPEISLIDDSQREEADSLCGLIDTASDISKKIVSSITDSNMSELEKADAVYEYLIKNAEYGDANNPLSYTAYGALAEGKAVCQGYSGAFNMLCKAAGVMSLSVYNDDHMWNVVVADGQLYHYDVTFDDAGDNSYNKYYRINNTEFIPDDDHKNYTLPLYELFIK